MTARTAWTQEALVEAAGQRHGPLDQRGHLVQQVVRNHRPAAQVGGGGDHALAVQLNIQWRPKRSVRVPK